MIVVETQWLRLKQRNQKLERQSEKVVFLFVFLRYHFEFYEQQKNK
jgi:hypothetical protein